MDRGRSKVHTGSIHHCPRCGGEFKSRFVSVDFVNDLQRALEEARDVLERASEWLELSPAHHEAVMNAFGRAQRVAGSN
jgi:hypothetical protein